MKIRFGIVAAAGLAVSSAAYAQPEVEPNESRAQALANGAFLLPAGPAAGVLTGVSTSTSTTGVSPANADMFLVRTAAQPLGIYRNRLTIPTVGHTGTIRGLSQTGAVQATWLPGMVVGTATATDLAMQTSTTVTNATGPAARTNQWYSFGRPADIYYRVTGGSTTTAGYSVNYDVTPIVPINGPTNLNGNGLIISTLGQGHSTDTDFWVYDSNFNAIRGYGNDDEATTAISGVPGATGATLQSVLRRDYADGTYYLAISNFQTANNQASPSDDDFRTGSLLDFPDVIANSSTTTNLNVTVSIGGVQVSATKSNQYDVVWICFTVPTPGSAALLGMGGLVAMRRRR